MNDWRLKQDREIEKETKVRVLVTYGIMGVVIVLLLLTGNPSTGAHEAGSARGEKTLFTKHFQDTLFDITEHAVYSVEILLDDKEYRIGKNVIGIVIHDAHDKDVVGAEITFVIRDLPAGANYPLTPRVMDKGNGLYVVSGLDLQKEGTWELEITVKKDRIEDLVKFVLPAALKTRVPKGRYSP